MVVSRPTRQFYEFGPFRLDPAEQTLLRDGQPVPLPPKIFEILTLLVENHGHLFKKDELMQAVWPDSFVEEGNLTRNISTLRSVLGEGSGGHDYIETVPKRGYRFIGAVKVSESVEVVKGVINTEDGAQEPAVVGEPLERTFSERQQSRSVLFATKQRFALVSVVTISLIVLAYVLFFRRASEAKQPEIRSLAVLPLRSLSETKDDNYLGRALADTIIARVSEIKELKVRPTSAVLKYGNQSISSLDAARDLNVDSVLDGTMQRANDQLRINFNLLRTQDGASLWSGTFNVNPTNMFTLQDQVSQAVATHLRLTLRPKRVVTRPVNPDAVDYYMRAKSHLGLQDPKEHHRAVELLERAIETDRNFAEAYAALAFEYRDRSVQFTAPDKESEEKAWFAVNKALSLDPDLAEAHVSQAVLLWTHSNRFPHEAATQELKKALDLNPNLDEAHHQLANIFNHIGLFDRAQEEIQKAVAINPANAGARFRVGINLLYQCKYEQALAVFREATKFNPQVWAFQTAWASFQLGRKDEAEGIVQEALKKYPDDPGGALTSIQAMLAASAGDKKKAEALIQRAASIGKDYNHFHHTAYAIASAYALMKKGDLALKWLQTAADDGFPCYPLFQKDPNLDNLRQDPRFIEFMSAEQKRWQHHNDVL